LGNVPPAIEIDALRKRYGRHVALDGVTLRVPAGVVYGFLGPNGAGKTTTMRILLGLLRADAGTARALGHEPWGDGLAVRGRIGYLPSGAGLYPRMRGRDVLDYFSGLDRSPPVRRADLCEALRLGRADLGRPVRGYSKGIRQKLAIIQALQHDPDLAVLDEPTEGLDPLVQDGFVEMLTARRAAGRTTFLSSHVLSEVEALCDSAAIIRDGRIVAAGTIDELRGGRPRRVTIVADGPPPELPGCTLVSHDGTGATYAHHGDLPELLRALATLAPRDVRIEEPGLDEVFRGLYDARGAT
jgi:ABC-2 type transport system ATP-binding protein